MRYSNKTKSKICGRLKPQEIINALTTDGFLMQTNDNGITSMIKNLDDGAYYKAIDINGDEILDTKITNDIIVNLELYDNNGVIIDTLYDYFNYLNI